MQNGLPWLARARLRYWKFSEKHLAPLLPRWAKPYTTHLPVLLEVATQRPILRVLEVGCGEFSTLAFLDRSCFADLEQIVSLENDPRWAERVKELARGDPRLNLRTVSGLMAKALAAENPEDYDLIFLDDSRCVEDRCQTIATLASMRPQQPVVVIHDFEIVDYRLAALPFRRSFRVTGLNPHVGVLWNGQQLSKAPLRDLNRRLHKLPATFCPDNHQGWRAWLHPQSAQEVRH
ncbi:MAG TPA: hypothetical protein VG167_18705 [Verrucomicrobiae bacterium]|nr:hypothetical protein [Verrucomicrobiae bacterium]